MSGLFCLTAGATPAVPPAAAEPVAPPALEQFFSNSAFDAPILSPSGRYLALRTGVDGRRYFLVVMDLDTMKARSVAEFIDADIGSFQWVNDYRLVYNVHDTRRASGDRDAGPGLYAVNRDGSEPIQLADRTAERYARQPWNTFLLHQPGSRSSESIYVQHPMFDYKDRYFGTHLSLLDTATGKSEAAPGPNVNVSRFMLDFQGQPRLAVSTNAYLEQLHYLDPVKQTWRTLPAVRHLDNPRGMVTPLGFGPGGTLYVIANAGENLATLRTLDLATGTVSKEPLVSTPGYDFDGTLVVNHDKVLGVRVTTDAESNVWFDPAMKEIQAAVDKALPATVNLLTVPYLAGSPWVLVESYSDRQPATYMVYNRGTGFLGRVGSAYPDIQPARMGQQESVRYTARDGRVIPGLLTLPAGGARAGLPLVVLVHGGPWLRGASWRWQPESQFLASLGYAVLEPEFRGSTGFGYDHYAAGFKQWGLAMQNDIADGTRWAIAQGIADPKRVCIGGASYGGYSALMGLVNDPDLFRCGIDWIGVTDIELMYTGTWFATSDVSDDQLRYSMPLMIGDPKKAAAQLKATSPIQQAARITQPLLFAYGDEDQRVPLFHGKQFRSAVSRTNQQVEWVTYSGEGHGWSLPKNRIDFWHRVEVFLNKHLGGVPPSAAATAAPAAPAAAQP